MVKTHGLTHIALGVRDLDRSAAFYQEVLGAVVIYRKDTFIQLQTPGTRDVIVLEQNAEDAGASGGIKHFGFRLTNPTDIGSAIETVDRAGGVIMEYGEFCPGEPYIFFRDPDGYEIEIWHELPTPLDPV